VKGDKKKKAMPKVDKMKADAKKMPPWLKGKK
jgi:hypothetical protein